MSMGGDFFALTDDQLARLLRGTLDYGDFLYDGPGERPSECLADFEPLWFELTQVLAAERACGVRQTNLIPEICGYASSQEVVQIAARLAPLNAEVIGQRCRLIGTDAGPAEVWPAVQALAAFYQRAAERGNAVLFRVT
jgi:hypothetical protein